MAKYKTTEYRVWVSMKQRCLNPKNTNYHRYGGRGITVCKRWEKSFLSFLKDMGLRPLNYSLDRINNNGNYEPSNCRWATKEEQSNNMAKNIKFKFYGKLLGMRQIARIVGIKEVTIKTRIRRKNPLVNSDISHLLKHPKKNIHFNMNGNSINLHMVSLKTGINYHTLRQRVRLKKIKPGHPIDHILYKTKDRNND